MSGNFLQRPQCSIGILAHEQHLEMQQAGGITSVSSLQCSSHVVQRAAMDNKKVLKRCRLVTHPSASLQHIEHSARAMLL